jgi:cation diffusion facilitator family transporter
LPAYTPPHGPFSLELVMTAGVSNSRAIRPSIPEASSFSAEKRRVASRSMLAAAVMTLLKLGAGLLSGSLGVLSDAAHSGLDLAGAALTFFSVHVSDKPADEDHTYGHGKIENLSAFTEAGLMTVSCGWIVFEAVQRIFYHPVSVQRSIWPVLVLAMSIAVDLWRSRQLRAVALRTGSPALATDAFHFASDIWATLAVLVGLGVNWVGAQYHIAALHYADPLAAIVVSLMILRMTVRVGHEAVAALVDEIPAETRRQLVREVERVQGVLAVERARVRRVGAGHFADLTIALPRRFTFEHSGELVKAVTAVVQRVLPRADVVVHTIPRETRAESIFDRVRAVAARNNVSIHDLSIQSHHGRLQVELHVEIEETMRLREAHAFVTALEAEIRRRVPEIDSVLTHIESEPATIEQPEEAAIEQRKVERALQTAAVGIPEIIDVHAIAVGHTGEHIALSCHCTLPDELSMHRVHELITALEDRFKLECPEVYRVTIHPEPVTDNTR